MATQLLRISVKNLNCELLNPQITLQLLTDVAETIYNPSGPISGGLGRATIISVIRLENRLDRATQLLRNSVKKPNCGLLNPQIAVQSLTDAAETIYNPSGPISGGLGRANIISVIRLEIV